MKTKRFKADSVTVGDEGSVRLKFATLNVIDHDGDVIVPGAFTEGQKVRISAYNHSSWGNALPVGKGSIHTEGDNAIFEGKFFLDTAGGQETYKTVKAMGDLQEYSFGFDVNDSGQGMMNGRNVQFLKALTVHEVAPVLLGAGVGTQTLDIKSRDADGEKSLTLQAKSVAHAKSLINSGKVDRNSSWSFEAADGNALLGDGGEDWENYALWFLGRDPEADQKTKNTYRYPYGKDGKVYRRAVIAIKSRAAAQGEDAIATAAATLLDMIDKDEGKSRQFADHVMVVTDEVKELAQRAAEVKAMRAQKGKDIGEESKALLSELADSLVDLTAELRSLGDEDTLEKDAQAVVTEYDALMLKLQGA